ncbi:PEP-CTERM sorting domain-containing protein [Inhella sp.]|uniref:PEP-CTERM sorting domain-containing protein n=1 Tax=Inhella sp. TaxID=1921806 RepID=UPI0035AF58BB
MRAMTLVALGFCLGLSAPAQAGVEYRVAATVEAYVRGQSTQHVILIDPPQGGLRVDSSYAKAGREVFLSGLGLFDAQIVAQGLSSANASANGLRAEVWSSQQSLNPFQFGVSNGSSEATVYFTTTVQGAPGATGTVRLDTRFGVGVSPAPFGDGALFSGANLSGNATLYAQTPAAPACRGDCFAQKAYSLNLRDGDSLFGQVDQAWSLEVQAKAGDLLTLQLTVTAQAGAGYAVSSWFMSPWSNVSPFAAGAGIDSLDAVPQDGATAGPLASLWLSPGLSLAPTDGLVLRPDGSYGFTAPVPEPASALLLSLGLGLTAWVRRTPREV